MACYDWGDFTCGGLAGDALSYEYAESFWYTIFSQYFNPECEDGFYGYKKVYKQGRQEGYISLVLLPGG